MKHRQGYYARKLAEARALRASLREMLDAYWERGDGEPAPEFIKRAARLSRWKAPKGSLEGTKSK